MRLFPVFACAFNQWHDFLERNMSTTKETKRANATASAQAVVRMYPANSLKEQVRAPHDNLSAFKVLKDKFLTEK